MNHLFPHGDIGCGADVAYAAVTRDGNWRGLQSLRGWEKHGPFTIYPTRQNALDAILQEKPPMNDSEGPWKVRRTDKGGLTIQDRDTGEVIYASDPPGLQPMHPIHAKQIELAMKAYAESR